MLARIQDKLIGVVITLVTALVCFYFGSFTTKAQVIDIVEAKIINQKKNNIEKFAKNEDTKLLKLEMEYLKEGQKEIKHDLKAILNKIK